MEIRHLRYFVTVARERNFTRAAEKLHIAQPPLSRQIQQLEEEVGMVLFDRDSRPLRLTEAGRLLYEHAAQVLERFDDLRTMMKRFREAERPRFVIGFVASTTYAALPILIRRFRAATPGLDATSALSRW
jgi:DNA-binding transcriptional LysR family regulator